MKGMDGKNWNIREDSIRYKVVSIVSGKKKKSNNHEYAYFFFFNFSNLDGILSLFHKISVSWKPVLLVLLAAGFQAY